MHAAGEHTIEEDVVGGDHGQRAAARQPWRGAGARDTRDLEVGRRLANRLQRDVYCHLDRNAWLQRQIPEDALHHCLACRRREAETRLAYDLVAPLVAQRHAVACHTRRMHLATLPARHAAYLEDVAVVGAELEAELERDR